MSEERKKEEDSKHYSWNEAEESQLQEEIRAGEWQNLKRFDTYKQRSRHGKILATIDAITNRIATLEKMFYQLVRDHPQQSVKLLAEIKKLRVMKEYLLQCLIWEEQGEFDDHPVPSDLADIL